MLPVAFMLSMIGIIWLLYTCLHLLPLLTGDIGLTGCSEQLDASHKVAIISSHSSAHEACIQSAFWRGAVETVVQQSLTLMLLVCFGRAVFTDPGSVPDEPEWLPDNRYSKRGPEEIGAEGDVIKNKRLPKAREVKHTGARRFCKWCNRFKPDRSHHCRVCRSCVLRMDHHCPWIANCVGFRNHKFFFLLVLYSLVDCLFVLATMSESLHRSVIQETRFIHRFLIVFCMTLAAMMGVLLLLFSAFHSWLAMKATTTIEFCEKTYRHSGCSHRGSTNSIYDRGRFENMKAVLGTDMKLWLLPTAPPDGDGLTFKVSSDVDKDDDEDAETTGLLSKQRSHEGSPTLSDWATTLQSSPADHIVTTPTKDSGADVPSMRLDVAEAGDEEAPEVTAGEASIS